MSHVEDFDGAAQAMGVIVWHPTLVFIRSKKSAMTEPHCHLLHFVARDLAPEHLDVWRRWGASVGNDEHVMIEGDVVTLFVRRKEPTTLSNCQRSLRNFAARWKCPLPPQRFQNMSESEFEMATGKAENVSGEAVADATEAWPPSATEEMEVVPKLPANFDVLARAAWLELVGPATPVPVH